MQLPPALREAIDRELDGVALRDLARAAETLSERYRAEVRDGRFHVGDALTARAYLTTRLPATYAAIARSLHAAAEARPAFAPEAILDIGAGPGTATWAAVARWPDAKAATLVEGSAAMRAIGERLGAGLALEARWETRTVEAALGELAPHDLVIMAYVLDELAPEARGALIARLWALTGDTLLIVEPGTTGGWARMLAARDILIGAGAHILAPCPHAKACPLSPPDWCHFSARVARSRLHREAKGGTVPWEDEKFIYLAASRHESMRRGARVIAPVKARKSGVTLKLCQPDGAAGQRAYATRDREMFQSAKRLDWGDSIVAPPRKV